MIIDKVENIGKYSGIPQEAVDFVKAVTKEDFAGHYDFGNNVFANIDEYETKIFDKCKFEAHKQYIDIQLILDGIERLDYAPVEELKVSEAYNAEKDVMFFENSKEQSDSVILKSGKFALIYPHEAHKPQIAMDDKPIKVKKAVVKIHI